MDDKPPSVSEELNRKVLETMRNLEIQKAELAISDYEYGIAVKAIASCVLGLVDRDVTEIISLSEKIPVHTFPAYVRRPTVFTKHDYGRIGFVDNDGFKVISFRKLDDILDPFCMKFTERPEIRSPRAMVKLYNNWLHARKRDGFMEIGND